MRKNRTISPNGKNWLKQHGAEAFILKDNEKRPVYKVIAEVAREKAVTQIILGQTAYSRWEQMTKGSNINDLLREIPFVDLHIISVSRYLKDPEGYFEKGIRAYLVKEQDYYRLVFKYTKEVEYEGIFFKDIRTDFNSVVCRFMKGNKTLQVPVCDDLLKDFTNIDMPPDWDGKHGD